MDVHIDIHGKDKIQTIQPFNLGDPQKTGVLLSKRNFIDEDTEKIMQISEITFFDNFK